MDTLVTEALSRLNHPAAAEVVAAIHAARLDYSGAISAGHKRTRSVDAFGSQRVNSFLLPIAYVVDGDGIATQTASLAIRAVTAVLQGDFASQTRETGLSLEERSVGYGCVVSQWKGDGTPGRFLSALYLLRKGYQSIADHDPAELATLIDLIIVCESILGDPIPEEKRSASAVASLFAKRR